MQANIACTIWLTEPTIMIEMKREEYAKISSFSIYVWNSKFKLEKLSSNSNCICQVGFYNVLSNPSLKDQAHTDLKPKNIQQIDRFVQVSTIV